MYTEPNIHIPTLTFMQVSFITSLQAAVLSAHSATLKDESRHCARQRLLTDRTKQWQTQSDQHDGTSQINGCFYLSSTVSELKTRKRKKRNANMLISFIYIKNKTFSKGKKRKGLIVNPRHSKIHLHIDAPVQPVCAMCRYHLTVHLDPTPLLWLRLCLALNSAGPKT